MVCQTQIHSLAQSAVWLESCRVPKVLFFWKKGWVEGEGGGVARALPEYCSPNMHSSRPRVT